MARQSKEERLQAVHADALAEFDDMDTQRAPDISWGEGAIYG